MSRHRLEKLSQKFMHAVRKLDFVQIAEVSIRAENSDVSLLLSAVEYDGDANAKTVSLLFTSVRKIEIHFNFAKGVSEVQFASKFGEVSPTEMVFELYPLSLSQVQPVLSLQCSDFSWELLSVD
jgi:hypothetical protein